MAKRTPTAPTTEDREHMIAEAAYFLAEHRDFEGGDPQEDWCEAESEIDRFLDEQTKAQTH